MPGERKLGMTVDPKLRAALVERMRQEAEGAANALKLIDPSIKDVPVKEMGPLSRFFFGGEGIAGRQIALLPGQNTLYYDPEVLADVAGLPGEPKPREVIEHELQHARQRNKTSYLQWLKSLWDESGYSYGAGPLEGGAFVAESELYKKWPGKDVYLPPEEPK